MTLWKISSMRCMKTNLEYHLDIRPDNTWVYFLPNKRLLGRGTVFSDKHFAKFLDRLENGKVSRLLKCLLDKYGIEGEPALIYANADGFRFIKGEMAYRKEAIGHILQRLVDSLQ